jgi:hypothetical protein
MNSYEEKQEARRERYLARAEQARTEGRTLTERAHDMASVIPFGQPILVGHHSEKRDRAYRERIQNTFRKGFETMGKAEYYENKADSVGTGGISSDDPDAIAKLEKKLAQLIERQEMMKTANAIIRKYKGDSDMQAAALIDKLHISEEAARKLLLPDVFGGFGFASFSLSNNNANIRSTKARIERLKALRERENREEEHEGYIYKEDTEENRVMFIFDGKPEDAVRDILKRHAFRWSPSRKAWVRQLTSAGRFAAQYVRKELDSLA